MNSFPTRYWLVVGTFCLSVLLYVDRACIATAKDAIVNDLVLSDIQWAWVLASFAFGYALFQTPSGMMADRLGSRSVLTVVVTAWFIFTGMTAREPRFCHHGPRFRLHAQVVARQLSFLLHGCMSQHLGHRVLVNR